MKTQKYKLLYVAGILALLAITAAIGLIFFWALYPYEVLDIKSVNLQTPVVKRGENVVFNFSFCKKSEIEPKFTRYLIDGIVLPLSIEDAVNLPTGCYILTRTVNISEKVPTGKYKFGETITYKVNPIKNNTYYIETDYFLIIE